jgi:hypothetical protein
MCVFFCALKGGAFMLNKAFSQLTEAERIKKFDTVIRRNTENLLNAERIQALLKDIQPNRQCVIIVHPVNREGCEALLSDDNVLHIYIPENQIQNERD